MSPVEAARAALAEAEKPLCAANYDQDLYCERGAGHGGECFWRPDDGRDRLVAHACNLLSALTAQAERLAEVELDYLKQIEDARWTAGVFWRDDGDRRVAAVTVEWDAALSESATLRARVAELESTLPPESP